MYRMNTKNIKIEFSCGNIYICMYSEVVLRSLEWEHSKNTIGSISVGVHQKFLIFTLGWPLKSVLFYSSIFVFLFLILLPSSQTKPVIRKSCMHIFYIGILPLKSDVHTAGKLGCAWAFWELVLTSTVPASTRCTVLWVVVARYRIPLCVVW